LLYIRILRIKEYKTLASTSEEALAGEKEVIMKIKIPTAQRGMVFLML
jgi:hypothetical protein|tara:strand:- start:425 stop:568 length:144 start_codon:yes stop_codon:yes gene_type:complete